MDFLYRISSKSEKKCGKYGNKYICDLKKNSGVDGADSISRKSGHSVHFVVITGAELHPAPKRNVRITARNSFRPLSTAFPPPFSTKLGISQIFVDVSFSGRYPNRSRSVANANRNFIQAYIRTYCVGFTTPIFTKVTDIQWHYMRLCVPNFAKIGEEINVVL